MVRLLKQKVLGKRERSFPKTFLVIDVCKPVRISQAGVFLDGTDRTLTPVAKTQQLLLT